ncbi:MAG: glucosaminidase domain-containing protein [Muribaculaceae bacterium]|nr:glucosaminidase domain-containing protein [Muribaculaceae bacterium]
MERFCLKKSGKSKWLVSLLLLFIPLYVVAGDDVKEMSLEEAIDMAYDEYIRDVAPESLRPFASLSIMGNSAVGADIITEFVRRYNPDFDSEIAQAFIEVGHRYGIRADVALCQAIVETGWFKYGGGTAVTADCHNYCGLGVTAKGRRGAAFASVSEGVTAHIQHLYAYCCNDDLPKGERLVDPRFNMVNRGCARRWHDLNGRWAMNNRYSTAILSVYSSLNEFASGYTR